MDQELLWTNIRTRGYRGGANVQYIDLESDDDDSVDLNIWNSGGPSSSRHSLAQVSHDGIKMEHGWSSSLTINGSQEISSEERRLESTNMLLGSRIGSQRQSDTHPVENGNLNLNSNPAEVVPSFLQNPTPSFLRNLDHNAEDVGRSSRDLEAGNYSAISIPGTSGSVHVPPVGGSSILSGSSCHGVGYLSERDEGTARNSFDDRRFSCKRKSIEGASAQFSAGGSSGSRHQGEDSLLHSVSARHSANTTLSISSPSHYPSITYAAGQQLNPSSGTSASVGASDCQAYNIIGSAEGSQRNCRVRINSAQHVFSSPSQWVGTSSLRSTDLSSANQASSSFVPFNQSQESRLACDTGPSATQLPALPLPSLVQSVHPFPLNVVSGSRRGSSSRSSASAAGPSREETCSMILPRNNISEQSIVTRSSDSRNLMQPSSNWSLGPTAQTGSSSQAVQSQGPTWVTHQNPPIQYQPVPPMVSTQQSLVPAPHTGSHQSINVPAPPSGPSNTLQEIRNRALRLQRSYMRSASGAVGDISSVRSLGAARESRSRMLSEHIRNALARRGEHIQLEGVQALFDPAVLYGRVADLHDRHRDMRLDVDNMSYEELLALTERIGNVSTGLSEETILRCLKRRKHISLTEEPASEVEPCCICQEEYIEEDDVGRLDCGHDFHTGCIKKWLTIKNLCPICKTTGIATSSER